MSAHDLLLSIGGDLFTLSLPSDVDPLPPDLPVVHLDVDPWELGKNYPTVAILGDPKATLPDLIAEIEARMDHMVRATARARLESVAQAVRAERDALAARGRAEADRVPIQPLSLLQAIGETLPRGAVVVEEALSSGTGLRQLIRSDDPQSFFGLRGGGIGWGLPAAIGIKLALPDRPVVALIGDGSAMYTCQALWTVAHDRIAVVFVILNNSSYRILKQRTNGLHGHAAQTGIYVGMDLTDPPIDFVGLARALGIDAERAWTVAEAIDLIQRGLVGDKPVLIDVVLDRAFKPV